MQQHTPTLGDLLATLRRSHDMAVKGPVALKALLNEVVALCAAHEQAQGYPPPETVPLALAVRDIAASDSSGTILGACIEFWLSMPVSCWNHAIRQINGTTLPFNICEPVLNALPAHYRLLLAHETLRGGMEEDTPLGKWSLTLLEHGSNWPFEELLLFLEHLFHAKRILNLQVAERFRQMKLAQQCTALADAPPHPEMGMRAAMALCILEQPPSANTLAKARESDSVDYIATLLQAARHTPAQNIPPDLTKALLQLAQHPHPMVRKDALFTMVVLNVPNLTTIFLLVLRKFTKERNYFYPALLYLSPSQFSEFLSMMPPKLKQDALAYLLHLFMTCGRDLASHSMTSASHILKTLPKETAGHIKSFMLSCRRKRYLEPLESSIRTPRPHIQKAQTEESSLFARKKTSPETLFAQALSSHSRMVKLDLAHVVVSDALLENRELQDVDLSNSSLTKLTFKNCTLKQVNLQGATLSDVHFTECRFDQCDLSAAMLESCSFTDCTFTRLDASVADIYRTSFTNITVSRSLFTAAHLHTSSLHEAHMDEAVLWETGFTRVEISATHFQQTDFTRAEFFGCTLLGCTFGASTFCQTSFERSRMEHTSASAGNYYRCNFRQTISDEPHLLMSAEHQRFNELMELAISLPPSSVPKWCHTVPALAEHVLTQVLLFRNVIRCRYRFLRQNNQRITLTHKTLDTQRSDFFTLLPLLIETDLFERQFTPSRKWPIFNIAGYAPTYRTLQVARTIFGADITLPAEPAPRTVDAVYTIGSVGSIAMTSDSDIDYWLSIDPKDFTPREAAALTEKLEHISGWAEEQFGLETTFFVMNRTAIIENDFGISDKESSGSAQALLLKEEFYRTALKVCGRDLAWWAMPPHVDRATHNSLLKQYSALPFNAGDSFVDFGIVEAIPPEEYFGAALWQIVKAFKNPFKSVMKLGILEAYIAAQDDILLCETIKEHILSGNRLLLKTDPYVTLMRTLQDHYHRSGNKDAAMLLQTAFLAKLHDTSKAGGNRLLYTLRKRAINELYGTGTLLKQQDFTQAKVLGDKLNAFFLKSYATLQQRLSEQQITARISPEDVTRLGRKIFAAFAPQEDKVARLPFVNSMGRTIRELMFKKDTTPGKRKKWIAMGLPQGVASRREAFVEIKTESDPVRLMAWLVANGLYYSGMHVEVDMTMSPIAAQDVVSLLQGLHDFFPKTLLETDTEQTLRGERVLRAYCVLNFTLPRDTSVQKQASVAYVTNWGEMFCSALDVDDPVLLTKSLRSFLNRALSRRVTADTEMTYLIPSKSRTPRVAIA